MGEMKLIVQRVKSASVSVDGETISSIGKGLCVLVGIHRDDTPAQRETLVRKLLNLRVFEDESGGGEIKRWDKSVKDLGLDVLCVSQFTLYGEMKGNKPDFRKAMSGDVAKDFYDKFLAELKQDHHEDKIKNGQFGAFMQVHIQNDGPVTIELEANPQPPKQKPATKNKGE